jgi:hypothetical protein
MGHTMSTTEWLDACDAAVLQGPFTNVWQPGQQQPPFGALTQLANNTCQ